MKLRFIGLLLLGAALLLVPRQLVTGTTDGFL